MKQIKNVKEKENYLKFSFLFPIIYSIINMLVVIGALFIYSAGSSIPASYMGVSKLVVQAAAIFLTFSPTALMVTMFISTRHRKRYVNASSFYRRAPLSISFIVTGVQVVYLVLLSISA